VSYNIDRVITLKLDARMTVQDVRRLAQDLRGDLPCDCPAIRGQIEAILIWERGDSFSGLRIVDGVMSEPAVLMLLAPEEKRP
jgi:hypothetical protein